MRSSGILRSVPTFRNNTQQAGALQTDIEACVDLWHIVVGMHKTEQHSHNTEISRKSTQEHSQCTSVRPEH